MTAQNSAQKDSIQKDSIQKDSARDDIYRRLQEAIDGLRKDALRVEIWATAMAGFAKPVPDYRPDPKFQLPKRDKKQS